MSDKLAVIQGQETIDELKKIEMEGRKVVTMFKDMVKQANLINRSLNTGRLREFNSALQELNRTTQQHTSLEQQLASALERTARLELQQARLATEQARARTELARAITEESRSRQQSAREAAAEERQNRNGSGAYRQLIRDRNEARTRARDYGAEMVLLNRRLRDGTITQQEYRRQLAELSRNFNTTSREAVQLDRDVRRLNQSTSGGNRTGALQGRVTDILKAFGVANIIDNVASSFYRLGRAYYDTSLKLETLRMSQKSIFKTNEEVGRQNEFLTGIAQKYGIELISLSQAYNQFSASAQGTTLEGEKSQIIFDAVSKSSAMLGVTTEDTNGILRALGQMMSKGKVQAEELRGQLGDRMAGAFRLFADGMGVSTAELDQMLKKGEVLAEDVLPKFATQLNKKYKLGIGEDVETSQASLTRLTNAWTIFVDNVEQRSSTVGSSISSITNVITGLLKEMTPSSFITDIQKQQVEFNKLGILLRQNFGDTKKRKELIDQMISVNPFWLDGLDKEKVTLEEINERLMLTNQQYLQKIILQKSQDELNELLDEQAERIRIIAQAYAENAVAINNLTPAQYKIMQSLVDGKITIDEAQAAIRKLGGNYLEVTDVFNRMNIAVNTNTITSKGYIGTTKTLNEQAKGLTDQYNGQIKVLNQIIKSNGNLLGINTTMMNSNYMLGGSYDYLRQKQDLAAIKQNQDYQKSIKAARELKIAYAEFNGFFFDANTAKNTGKKVGEWDLIDNKLVKRKPQGLPDKPEKPKAASLTAAQKDFVMEAQGVRDNEIASIKERRLNLKIDEEKYWKEYEAIIVKYSEKISNYLKGSNAKEKQVQGAARRKGVEAQEQANKEVYDFRTKRLEENFKKESNIFERQTKNLEQNQTVTDLERLTQQIAIDSKSLEQTTKYYDAQIALAGKSAQSVIEWERKRDEEIGKIEDERLKRLNSIPEAFVTDIENQAAITQSKVDSNFEDQKSLILKDKALNAEQRAYKLSQLEKNIQIEKNNQEIKRLDLLKAQILAQQLIRTMKGQSVQLSPDEEKALKEYEATIKGLENQNKGLGSEKSSEVAPEWLKTKDILVKGFQDMGLGNFASAIGDQFDDLYKKIVDGSISAKDAAILAASAIADSLSSMVNRQKENTIAALDEQLKYSQETAEQETEFINGRLEQLNSLDSLTKEQMDERAKLEDEARVVKEQQQQREKMIETQKAKAEQKAAAQQALINGALAATMTLAQMGFIAGAIPAALALAFGIAQSVAIMSKDPTPKYFKGRKGGKAENAWTQEQGAEIITDKNDNIKTLGSGSGPKMTWLDAGDKVYTASESRRIMKTLGSDAKIGRRLVKSTIKQSLQTPIVNVTVNQSQSNENKKLESAVRKALKDYAPTTIRKENGKIIKDKPGYVSKVVGTYDLKTGEETWI